MVCADLPDECPTYYGVHSVECLSVIWIAVQCLPEGDKFPKKLSASEVSSLSSLNYK